MASLIAKQVNSCTKHFPLVAQIFFARVVRVIHSLNQLHVNCSRHQIIAIGADHALLQDHVAIWTLRWGAATPSTGLVDAQE